MRTLLLTRCVNPFTTVNGGQLRFEVESGINCKYIGEQNLREQTKHCKGENLTRRFQPAFYFEDNWIYLDQELVRTLLLTRHVNPFHVSERGSNKIRQGFKVV